MTFTITHSTAPVFTYTTASNVDTTGEMRPEYDIRGGVRGKYISRLSRWQQIIAYLKVLWR